MSNPSLLLRSAALALAAVSAASMTLAGPANAAPSEGKGVEAKFEGKILKLKESWGEATSCVALSADDVTCYRTSKQADDALAKAGLVEPDTDGPEKEVAASDFSVAALPDCASGWLCLWSDSNGGGKRLIFQDEFTQNLSDYGFQNQTSSYRNRQSDGGGYLYENEGFTSTFTIQANAYNSFIGDFNDRADQVRP